MDVRNPEQTSMDTGSQVPPRCGKHNNEARLPWTQVTERFALILRSEKHQTPQAMCPGPALLGACSETKRSEEIVSNGKRHEQDKRGSTCAQGVRARRTQVVLGVWEAQAHSQGDFVCVFVFYLLLVRQGLWSPSLASNSLCSLK